MVESGLTRQQTFSLLIKSPHGNLADYLPIGRRAAQEDPEYFAHLIAWNHKKGEIRDSKVALPLIAVDTLIASRNVDDRFMGNALAHLGSLSPRELLKGVEFAKLAKLSGRRRRLLSLVNRYLHNLESHFVKWERAMVQHRKSMHQLYVLSRHKPKSPIYGDILFRSLRPVGSVFEVIANLSKMSPTEAVSEVITRKIPFLIAAPALGDKLKDKDVLTGLIAGMSPAELTIHMKMLEKLGVTKDPTLRGAMTRALERIPASKANALKLTKAVDALDDEELRDKVEAAQEKKFDKSSFEGNWLVLADASSSMVAAIDLAKEVAALLTRLAKGSVHLVFFNTTPIYHDVTGKSLGEIAVICSRMRAYGSTSIGVGLQYAVERKLDVDGVAIVSDGGENHPPSFSQAFDSYEKMSGKRLPVYLFRVQGDPDRLSENCRFSGIEIQRFDISGKADYYSLPNLIATMRTNRYSLTDEIMETKLLDLDQVLAPYEKSKLVTA